MRTAILGSGSFGTAIASVLAANADEVGLWGRAPEVADTINARHENANYLPGLPLPPGCARARPGWRPGRTQTWWSWPRPRRPPAR